MKGSQTYPEVVFTPGLIQQVGHIGKVLGEFLDHQTGAIQSECNKKFSGSDPEAIMHILHNFITLEGTKRPLGFDQIKLSQISNDELTFCLDRLEKARILRFEDGVYELAHDTLAHHISETRSAEEVAFLEVIKLVGDRFGMYKSTSTLLNTNELHMIGSFENKLKKEGSLTAEEWSYIAKSRRNRQRRRIIAASLIVLLFVILSGFSLYSLRQTQLAKKSQSEAVQAQQEAEQNLKLLEESIAQRDQAQYNEHFARGIALMNQSDYESAMLEFENALDFREDDPEALQKIAECEQLLGANTLFDNYMKSGDSFAGQGNAFLVDARTQYRRALQTGYNNAMAQSKLRLLEDRLEAAFEKFVDDGDTFFAARGYANALENYEHALRIKPGDSGLIQKIALCKENL